MSDLREPLRGLEVFSEDLPALATSRPPADPRQPFIGRAPAAVRAKDRRDGWDHRDHRDRCPGTGWKRGRLWT